MKASTVIGSALGAVLTAYLIHLTRAEKPPEEKEAEITDFSITKQ